MPALPSRIPPQFFCRCALPIFAASHSTLLDVLKKEKNAMGARRIKRRGTVRLPRGGRDINVPMHPEVESGLRDQMARFVEERRIYAFEQTGLIPTQENMQYWDQSMHDDYNRALAEYDALQGRPVQ
jgi:hypothetical protein